jgi:type IV secretion system protein VirD4
MYRRRHRARLPLGVDLDAGIARCLPKLEVKEPVAGRLTLGRVGGRLVAAEPGASLAVIGPSGCGKTAGFAIPALLEWQGPVVATSVKTDLLGKTIEARRHLGNVWVYDPTACAGVPRSTWSPIPSCRSWGGAQRVTSWLNEAADPKASSVSDGHYWNNQARIGLAPLLHAAAVSGATMCDVVRWVDTQEIEQVRMALARAGGLDPLVVEAINGPDGRSIADQHAPAIREYAVRELRQAYVAEGGQQGRRATKPPTEWPPEWQARLDEKIDADLDAVVRAELEVLLLRTGGRGLAPLVAAEALWAKEERLRGSVYATIQNLLLVYGDPEVAASAAGSDIDLDAWLSGPNTIYLVASPHDQQRIRPVLTLLLNTAMRAAYDTANRAGGCLPHPCLALLDEAGNVAPARDLPVWASTARSHGISLATMWQDLAQIQSIYGDLAPVILNNHKAKVFGSGISDPQTLDLAARLVGEQPVKERNAHHNSGGAKSWSEHTAWRRVAPGDALRRLNDNEGLLIYGNQPPARLQLRPYWRERRLARAATTES